MADPELAGALELIPGRFYWTSRRDTPADTPTSHYFNTDDVLTYDAFFQDFGPLNLSKLYRYVQLVKGKVDNKGFKGKRIIHCSGIDPKRRSNSAWLAGAFMIVELGKTPEEAWQPFSVLKPNPFVPFRDASQGVSTYQLSLVDCFRGLYRAKKDKFFDFSTFDLWEYEHYEQIEHGDFNVICDKFIAFSGPFATKTEVYPGLYTMVPSDYFEIWRKKNVTAIVRLNKKTYDRKDFTDAGFHHYDLYFLDGSVPPESIARKFLEICEQEKGCVAVHCKAGLGRTGTLIGLYIMKHYRWTAAEFMAWNRIVRPGSVIGPQQNFLRDWEGRMWSEGDKMRGFIKAQPGTRDGENDANTIVRDMGGMHVSRHAHA